MFLNYGCQFIGSKIIILGYIQWKAFWIKYLEHVLKILVLCISENVEFVFQ
jgi:hypothetical protein